MNTQDDAAWEREFDHVEIKQGQKGDKSEK